MTPAQLIDGLAHFATGVTILSVQDALDDIAMTVTSFVSISLTPPLVAVSVTDQSYLVEVLDRREEWGVSVLSAEQKPLAGRFAASGRPSPRLLLADTDHHRGPRTGALLLDHGLATFECRTTRRISLGDHLLVVGEVLSVSAPSSPTQTPPPLIRFDRTYRSLG